MQNDVSNSYCDECVCVRARERERKRESEKVAERERERYERNSGDTYAHILGDISPHLLHLLIHSLIE